MGSYDGAEVCELGGTYILNSLSNFIEKTDIGLYRDDGLLVLKNAKGRTIDLTRKKIIKCFSDFGFHLDIQTNLKIVNFLDITFNLSNNTYKPYKKPNDKLQYIHTSSNHPPQIIKQLPQSISKRLSTNSSSNEIFNESKYEYEEALQQSGYKNNELI